jgi:arylsulfatase A-like enzyme
VLFACCAALAWLFGGCGEERRPRSVVLVVVDTWRADHLGFHGYPRATTPALEPWLERAAVFERALATAGWTLPSFGSLFTGHIPSRHAAGLLLEAGEKPQFAFLDGSERPLGERLSQAGFATAGVVNNPFLHPGFGLSRGFETWDYVFGNYSNTARASQIVHWGFRWLDARDERPFLLLLHLFDPHLSYDPPPAVRGRFTGGYKGRFELPFTGFGDANAGWMPPAPEDRRFVADAYDEELLFVDRELGRLLAGLQQRGLLEDTLVVLTSDHGEELFDHGGFEHGHTLFQELLHVPLIFWGPGVAPGRIDEPVSLVDVLPTLLDALGLPADADLAGRSLWPLLTERARPPETSFFAEGTLHGIDRKALVRWPWKLVASEGEAPRLYDLSRDPGEQRDLAAAEPDRVAQLLKELGDGVARAAAGRSTQVPARVDAEIRKQLEALGYLD